MNKPDDETRMTAGDDNPYRPVPLPEKRGRGKPGNTGDAGEDSGGLLLLGIFIGLPLMAIVGSFFQELALGIMSVTVPLLIGGYVIYLVAGALRK